METASVKVDAPREFIEFENPDEPGSFFRIDVTFMLSHYNCIFGRGCPSIASDLPRAEAGCCSLGVTMSDKDDLRHIEKQVAKLTSADSANFDLIQKDGWKRRNKKGKIPKKAGKVMTALADNACIFINPPPEKPEDPPMGCSFHVLADRLGISHVETKPKVCWQVPLYVDHDGETSQEDGCTTITGMTVWHWGGEEPNYEDPKDALRDDYIAWWCIDTPDAYNGPDPVYVSLREELVLIMGLSSYEKMSKLLMEYGERKFKMPGELVNDGQPTIATVTSLYESLREMSNK